MQNKHSIYMVVSVLCVRMPMHMCVYTSAYKERKIYIYIYMCVFRFGSALLTIHMCSCSGSYLVQQSSAYFDDESWSPTIL